MSRKTYTELIKLDSFEERYRYLKLAGVVAEETFGHRRHINQKFYKSPEWLRFRDEILLRDNGCDLAFEDSPIFGPILVHHLNPITYDDIVSYNRAVFDPDNVVCVSRDTHLAIHYGDEAMFPSPYIERRENDTVPWKINE